MCCLLVSGFLTEITQQIHSLRASGVISSHFARATGSEMRTFRKSAGTLCTAPGEIAFLVMDFILHRYPISLGSPSDAVRIGPQRKANLDKRGESMPVAWVFLAPQNEKRSSEPKRTGLHFRDWPRRKRTVDATILPLAPRYQRLRGH
jgi:hypothetical protein